MLVFLRNLNWCSGKNVQNGDATLPFDVNNGLDSSSENFKITSSSISNLCTLRQSKTASFNADQVGDLRHFRHSSAYGFLICSRTSLSAASS